VKAFFFEVPWQLPNQTSQLVALARVAYVSCNPLILLIYDHPPRQSPCILSFSCGAHRQSNMELPLHYTLTRNQSYSAVALGSYDNIRIFHFDHNPQHSATYTTNGSVVVAPWQMASTAMSDRVLDGFSAACWYFGETLTDWMRKGRGRNDTSSETGASPVTASTGRKGTEEVPIGLIQSAFGGTASKRLETEGTPAVSPCLLWLRAFRNDRRRMLG
jgi:hypothetical protein